MLGALLLAAGSLLAPAMAGAADPASDPDATAGSGSTDWGPIVGACFGVLFGGALAVWQIRGMKRGR